MSSISYQIKMLIIELFRPGHCATCAARNHKLAPPPSDYHDEISKDQIAAIRHVADPDGKRAGKRVILYPQVA